MSHFTDDLIRTATEEWDFFGRSAYNLNGTTVDGKKEYQDGAWQRIGTYWQNIGGPYARLTGKDRGYPWSAAFVSFCMTDAKVPPTKFGKSAAHSSYINDAIRAMVSGNRSTAFFAQDKRQYPLKPGDLVAYWRGGRPISIGNALSVGYYQSHCDIVVDVNSASAYVIGGNVGNSVTRKELRIDSQGRLTDTGYKWFVILENLL
ncbi:DUF2272 domain-containing protein [Neorhizobium alkalisoli]|uniref:DUF2272 domain-containing protein n=1 Tax=Neorhizobium alkalisoli TaxID=528178 RepID=UPI000CF9D54D|nr:DUF2272 domain-containing protein [Neorhizobium alkalisoli]